jgi:hypothetical protein
MAERLAELSVLRFLRCLRLFQVLKSQMSTPVAKNFFVCGDEPHIRGGIPE